MNNTVFENSPATPRTQVTLLGVPLDSHSSFLRGAALAPQRIRAALHSGSANWSTELGIDLSKVSDWMDQGDLKLSDLADPFAFIENSISNLLDAGIRVLTLGGDHAITYPIIRAYGSRITELTILHIDAHPDLYDELQGDRLSHASPFARIMESGLANHLVQVGIRTLNPHQREQAERFGVDIFEMRQLDAFQISKLSSPLYISLDLDALDPAFAPGVSHHEPGGLTTRQVLDIIQQAPGPIVGADIVEYNPIRDPLDITAMLAAKFTKELIGRLLEPSHYVLKSCP
jgi:arginase